MTEPTAATKYQAIAKDLRDKIASGSFVVGDQLPTKAELMSQYGVALNTVDRALDVLRDLGLIESHQGIGTFVRAKDVAEHADIEARVSRLEAQMAELFELLGRRTSPEKKRN